MENSRREPSFFLGTTTDAERKAWQRIIEPQAKSSAEHNAQKPQKVWRPFERLRKLTGWDLLATEMKKETVRTEWALGYPSPGRRYDPRYD